MLTSTSVEKSVVAICVVAAFALIDCGQADIAFIAGAFDAGGGGTGGRARVRVAGASVVTDKGTVLRSISIPIDITPQFPLSMDLFDDIAQRRGLNAVQVYVENWTEPTGANLDQADRLVDEAERAGLYVVVGIGGGPSGDGHPGNGWFDINKVRSFWQLYAPRYKYRTHVLYQIQNQPEQSCDVAWQSPTIGMEREAYRLVRLLAPDTHIIMFSFRGVPLPSLVGSSIDLVADVVDWSNASVGMGGNPSCVTNTSAFAQTFATIMTRRASIAITDMPPEVWVESALKLVRLLFEHDVAPDLVRKPGG